ncbi:MAG: hypothetical protein EHM12_08235 [Dehalococcoidia bacterium]|nr:MAG: hypothetical protein EHM12_08235 [Dehalococcoidia bacterium]
MPDVFDEDGLTIKTLSEITEEIEDDMKDIYGDDISIASDSPDGQQINIVSQEGADLRELLSSVNAGFDIDQAEGAVLDQRVALIGLTRNAGTFTYQDIEITIDRALGLVGLDDEALTIDEDDLPQGLFTVRDGEGNLFYLLQTQAFTGAGTYTCAFRAAQIGKVEVISNTITTIVTVVAGVTAVNNPSAASSIGRDEETDSQLKLRAKISTSLNAVGNLDAMEAALLNLAGVTVAKVYENDTDVTDADGLLPHSMRAIVEGGDPDEIAAVIYAKRSFGCRMMGDQEVIIERTYSRSMVIKYDIPVQQDIYIRFSLSGAPYVESTIKDNIVSELFWEIGYNADSSTVIAYLKSLNSRYVITDCELSLDGVSWSETVSIGSLNDRFINSTDRITIL